MIDLEKLKKALPAVNSVPFVGFPPGTLLWHKVQFDPRERPAEIELGFRFHEAGFPVRDYPARADFESLLRDSGFTRPTPQP
jgi:hypothetical protein